MSLAVTPFTLFIYFYLFVFGAIVGSFLNVCIWRIPQHEKFWDAMRGLVSPPSSCPRCKNRIPGWCNVPILGWLFLRGRCYFCKGWISPRYPLIEFFNGALFVLLYAFEVPGDLAADWNGSWAQGLLGPVYNHIDWWRSPSFILHARYAYHLILVEALLVASFIDIDLRVIPDGSTLPAMTAGVIGSLAGMAYLTPVYHQDPRVIWDARFIAPWLPEWLFLAQPVPQWIAAHPHWHGLAVSVTGLLIGGGFTWLMRVIAQWGFRKEAIGFGDVILMALIGSFLGWQATIIVFFMAPLLALILTALSWPFRRLEQLIPYGPYLSLAALIVMLCWKPIWEVAQRPFGGGPVLLVIGFVTVSLFAVIARAVQVAKGWLGLRDPEAGDEWSSADQLTYLAGETVDPQQGHWPTSNEWPGANSARGWTQYDTWKHPAVGSGFANWKRR